MLVFLVSVSRVAAGTAPLEEEPLPGPEHERSEGQPVLVDEVVAHEEARRLIGAGRG